MRTCGAGRGRGHVAEARRDRVDDVRRDVLVHRALAARGGERVGRDGQAGRGRARRARRRPRPSTGPRRRPARRARPRSARRRAPATAGARPRPRAWRRRRGGSGCARPARRSRRRPRRRRAAHAPPRRRCPRCARAPSGCARRARAAGPGRFTSATKRPRPLTSAASRCRSGLEPMRSSPPRVMPRLPRRPAPGHGARARRRARAGRPRSHADRSPGSQPAAAAAAVAAIAPASGASPASSASAGSGPERRRLDAAEDDADVLGAPVRAGDHDGDRDEREVAGPDRELLEGRGRAHGRCRRRRAPSAARPARARS